MSVRVTWVFVAVISPKPGVRCFTLPVSLAGLSFSGGRDAISYGGCIIFAMLTFDRSHFRTCNLTASLFPLFCITGLNLRLWHFSLCICEFLSILVLLNSEFLAFSNACVLFISTPLSSRFLGNSVILGELTLILGGASLPLLGGIFDYPSP